MSFANRMLKMGKPREGGREGGRAGRAVTARGWAGDLHGEWLLSRAVSLRMMRML